MARRAALRVIAASPLELLFSGGLLDHAERSEAAQLLAVRPDLFEERGTAVNGEDPRGATGEGAVQFRHAHPHFDSPIAKDLDEKIGIHVVLPLEKLRGGETLDSKLIHCLRGKLFSCCPTQLRERPGESRTPMTSRDWWGSRSTATLGAFSKS